MSTSVTEDNTPMGEIQDIEIITQALADAPLQASDSQTVRRYYERCHAEAISAYMEDMNQLDIFWRPAPDQSFPWEK